MKVILICIDWFSPAYKAGGPIQSISNLVANYSEENTVFHILCSNGDVDGSLNKGVAFDEWNNFDAKTRVWYCSSKTRSVAAIRNIIKALNPDIIFINGIYSLYFNLVPLVFGKKAKRIVSVRGMLHPGALSQKSLKKNWYLRLLKFIRLAKHCYFHATDEQEKDYIKEVFGTEAKVYIAGNFPHALKYQEPTCKEQHSLKLISVALISTMKNILLVLQALLQCKGNISYNLYGAVKDPVYWQQCLTIIEGMPANIKVQFHNDIAPSKVPEVLQSAHVFILPSKSENFGHAFYEALSAGKPVITSNNTPWNKLAENKAGLNIETATAAVTAAIDFFTSFDNEKYVAWSLAAALYAGNAVDTRRLKQQYEEMFSLRS